MISKLFKSYSKNKTRKRADATIVKANQKNDGVVNVYRNNPNNVGDFYCAPQLYFPEICNTPLDIFDYQNPDGVKGFIEGVNANSLIIGGGGLLNRGSFEKQLKLFKKIAARNKKTVLWGAGHNSKKTSEFGKVNSYNVDVTKFGLAGTRDYTMPGEFVPCVSCMHEVFDRTYEAKEEVGILFHTRSFKDKALLNRLSEIPHSFNHTNLEEMVNFIGKHEHIITNSYHAMYWGMILNRKVSVVPNSSKFYDFKYQPNFTTFSECLTTYKKAELHTGVKEECRELNIQFSKKVADYLSE